MDIQQRIFIVSEFVMTPSRTVSNVLDERVMMIFLKSSRLLGSQLVRDEAKACLSHMEHDMNASVRTGTSPVLLLPCKAHTKLMRRESNAPLYNALALQCPEDVMHRHQIVGAPQCTGEEILWPR